MDKNKQTLQEKVADFAAQSGQPVFLIDYDLFESLGNDTLAMAEHLVETHPTIFAGYKNASIDIQDKLRAIKKHKFMSFYQKRNGVKIIALQKPQNTHLLELAQQNKNQLAAFREDIDDKKSPYTRESDWTDYALYHELFHTVDPRLQTESPLTYGADILHKTEFFADFGACLYMASKGNNMFLETAKMRAINMQSAGLVGHFNKIYSNHHLYAVFKKEKIDPVGMSVQDIIQTTSRVTEKYAFNSGQLTQLEAFTERLDEEQSYQRLNSIARGTKAKREP